MCFCVCPWPWIIDTGDCNQSSLFIWLLCASMPDHLLLSGFMKRGLSSRGDKPEIVLHKDSAASRIPHLACVNTSPIVTWECYWR